MSERRSVNLQKAQRCLLTTQCNLLHHDLLLPHLPQFIFIEPIISVRHNKANKALKGPNIKQPGYSSHAQELFFSCKISLCINEIIFDHYLLLTETWPGTDTPATLIEACFPFSNIEGMKGCGTFQAFQYNATSEKSQPSLLPVKVRLNYLGFPF